MDKRTDVLNLISKLRDDIDNTETRSALIDQISDSISEAYDSVDTLNTANQELIHNNEQLRKANMKLFLQIGSEPQPAPEPKPQEPPARVPFSDLFNEKGELK